MTTADASIAPNTHAQLESFYAVPQLGAVVVPINYRLTPDDFAYIIAHSGARVVCAHGDYLEAVDSIRSSIPGVIHGSSGSGASLYLEPLSTVEINNDIVALEHQEREEVLRILKALTDAFRAKPIEGDGLPGEVLAVSPRLRVATGRGAVEISEVQPAGKSRMEAEAWGRGRGVRTGQVLE